MSESTVATIVSSVQGMSLDVYSSNFKLLRCVAFGTARKTVLETRSIEHISVPRQSVLKKSRSSVIVMRMVIFSGLFFSRYYTSFLRNWHQECTELSSENFELTALKRTRTHSLATE